jgi:hypothetical protein
LFEFSLVYVSAAEEGMRRISVRAQQFTTQLSTQPQLSIDRLQRLREPPSALTAKQVAQFDNDGVVLPLRGITAEEAAALLEKIEREEVKQNQSANQIYLNAHLTHDWMHRLVTRPNLVSMVKDLLGPDVYVWKGIVGTMPENHVSLLM